MTEFYNQTRTAKTQLSTLLISDFALMCSFILSHPLYFSYFIFFSPYLLKLLSFLSPLFITTTLLLFALLTLSPSLLHPQLTTDSKDCFLLSTCHNVLENLQTRAEDDDDEVEDICQFLELEAYRILFEIENPDEDLGVSEATICNSEQDPVEITRPEAYRILVEIENPVKDLGVSEATRCNSEQDPVEITRPEAYRILVEIENPVKDLGVSEATRCNSEQDPVEITRPDISEPIMEGFVQEIITGSESESITHNMEEKEVIKSITHSDKVEEQKEQPPPPPSLFMRSGSKAKSSRVSHSISKVTASENSEKLSTDNGGEYTSKAVETSETHGGSLGSFGSMRKDKEWKRTLACKLYEERHNVDGGEGMDSLWETYETDSNKQQPNKNNNTKKGKKGGIIEYDYENDDEEEGEVDGGQLCCLQALKFSSGKMTLGMGKPNLMRFSKALKGLGWLHHVSSSSSSKHGKKGCN